MDRAGRSARELSISKVVGLPYPIDRLLARPSMHRRYPVAYLGLGSRVVSVLDTGAVGPGFKSQPRRCRVTVLGKLFTPIVTLFTKQRNWQQTS